MWKNVLISKWIQRILRHCTSPNMKRWFVGYVTTPLRWSTSRTIFITSKKITAPITSPYPLRLLPGPGNHKCCLWICLFYTLHTRHLRVAFHDLLISLCMFSKSTHVIARISTPFPQSFNVYMLSVLNFSAWTRTYIWLRHDAGPSSSPLLLSLPALCVL